ncbi:hypothetical protein K3495_g16477, partial [Podosphaera aphanis]
ACIQIIFRPTSLPDRVLSFHQPHETSETELSVTLRHSSLAPTRRDPQNDRPTETSLSMDMSMDMTPHASGMSDMDSHPMSMNMDARAGMTSMSFFASSSTSLYITQWTPTSPAAYAATCVFLILLAILSKGLVAAKARLEVSWRATDLARRRQDLKFASSELAEAELEADAAVHHNTWRPSVDPVRAVLDTVMAGIGFLLMLAVMTMNIGYFVSVLSGIFLGSLAFGRFST